MQEQLDIEDEARRHLPEVLADLCAVPADEVQLEAPPLDRGIDLIASAGRESFAFELKTSGRPGLVDLAKRQLVAIDTGDAIAALLVPYMTRAGAQAAEDRDLNWVDLSGNAHVRAGRVYLHVEGKPNKFTTRGPSASPFAPKSSRIVHALLLDPGRWWRQVDLSEQVLLDDGYVSRVVRRLESENLLEQAGRKLRPRNPYLLLDAWADDYRFDRHKQILGHATGSGVELARDLDTRLRSSGIDHAFTGLPSAWAISGYARFRLSTVYVAGSPLDAAAALELRRNERGANVQILGPNDTGVFIGRREINGLPCVSPVQTYLDLQHLPERAEDAAEDLRTDHRLWQNDD